RAERERRDDVERADDGEADPAESNQVDERQQPGMVEEAGDGLRPASREEERQRQRDVRRAQIEERKRSRLLPVARGHTMAQRSIHSTNRGGASSVATITRSTRSS